ncbi:DUF2267 domain-containing protein [Saccharopolyspora soli]|uniref:DUF2267 domain-containing protein n=1 Tax=Saccharopolyspora soli TaxID=2926618 RepID=UPI0035565725
MDEVVRRSGLAGRRVADDVVQATVQTLARCTPAEPVAALAACLSSELSEHLRAAPEHRRAVGVLSRNQRYLRSPTPQARPRLRCVETGCLDQRRRIALMTSCPTTR